MAQQARFEVALAAVGIDHLAVLVLGHGVDGQVAAGQVVFQADVRAGVEGEAAIALAALALGARQGVFLAGLWVQEDREVRADRAESPGEHFIAGGADHHPVDIGDWPAEQPVAHGAANFVYLHGNPPLCGEDNAGRSRGEGRSGSTLRAVARSPASWLLQVRCVGRIPLAGESTGANVA
ncbi:hypothetical protein D3C81_1602830 [compost metagenome]